MENQISAHTWFKKLDKENPLWRIYLSIWWFAGLHHNKITEFNPKRLNQVNLAWVSLEFANTSSRRMTVCYRLWYWRHISVSTSSGSLFLTVHCGASLSQTDRESVTFALIIQGGTLLCAASLTSVSTDADSKKEVKNTRAKTCITQWRSFHINMEERKGKSPVMACPSGSALPAGDKYLYQGGGLFLHWYSTCHHIISSLARAPTL